MSNLYYGNSFIKIKGVPVFSNSARAGSSGFSLWEIKPPTIPPEESSTPVQKNEARIKGSLPKGVERLSLQNLPNSQRKVRFVDEGENGETKVKTAETFEEYCDKLRGIDKQTFAKINELSSKLLEGRKKKKFKAQRYSDISVWDDNYYNPNDGDAFMASCMNFSGKTYYACEAPQPQYFKQFWKMVWNTQTKTIFMLTNLMEKRKIKACAYWGDVRKVETYDDIVVSYVSDTFFKVNQNDVVDKVPKLEGPTKESYIQKRTFQLTSNRETHTVVQYHYLNWPDMGTPDKCALVDYLRQQHDITSPSVVHCSAGVGRTGTFIAYDSLVRECKQNKKAAVSKIDVNERILQMRFYRDGMVQTDGQRQFIEDACKYTLNK